MIARKEAQMAQRTIDVGAPVLVPSRFGGQR